MTLAAPIGQAVVSRADGLRNGQSQRISAGTSIHVLRVLCRARCNLNITLSTAECLANAFQLLLAGLAAGWLSAQRLLWGGQSHGWKQPGWNCCCCCLVAWLRLGLEGLLLLSQSCLGVP